MAAPSGCSDLHTKMLNLTCIETDTNITVGDCLDVSLDKMGLRERAICGNAECEERRNRMRGPAKEAAAKKMLNVKKVSDAKRNGGEEGIRTLDTALDRITV